MARFFMPVFPALVLASLVLASLVLASPVALSQNRADPGTPAPKRGERAPAMQPQATTLENLFEKLAVAKDAPEARVLANQIERRWLRSGSDTTDLLMGRVLQVMNAKDHEAALDLLDYIILLRPEWAEAYNKRATVMFMMDDYDGSMRDIRATLAREPRHYGALAGLGMIFQRTENNKSAYAAFNRALAIHPYLGGIKDAVERLKFDVEDKKL